ncbi:hypothetical protein BO99DRAFT_168139 [Aspergillus violaceofuscus CBS 115571]|uniref:Uncharacterized protein n=1 Tax=Aspergillus violaceofuscus (strain CBS 115571) TaxID=1450538 RepID=A0A2V5HQ26_ASPV1|nr:hypothetical protein BO99DRAFT_168139 [Aspergillus violaceofuscus CBS 115571]
MRATQTYSMELRTKHRSKRHNVARITAGVRNIANETTPTTGSCSVFRHALGERPGVTLPIEYAGSGQAFAMLSDDMVHPRQVRAELHGLFLLRTIYVVLRFRDSF